jgi:pyrimidine-specific ribonucleoside hydrolase
MPDRSSRLPLVIDADTGVDDALALLMAASSADADILAVSCVAGNVDVDQVVRNSLQILDACGRTDIPVLRGAEMPLVRARRDASDVHGPDGLGGITLPLPTRRPDSAPAVEGLAQALRASPRKVTAVTLGPLTNLALLIRSAPDAAANIDRVVTMSGALGPGNATPAGEFNAWADPEAAHIVLRSGIPITMYGLDVFQRAALSEDELSALRESTLPAGRLAHRLATCGALARGALGDAGTMAIALLPELARICTLPVVVSLDAGATRGQTIADLRDERHKYDPQDGFGESALVDVVTDIDELAVQREFVRRLSGQ